MLSSSRGSHTLRRALQATAVCTALSVSSAYAAPSISSVSGSISHGATVTINGSGFGTGDSTPLLWDNFDDAGAASGTALRSSPLIGSWRIDNRPTPVYSSTRAYSGSRSAYAAYNSSNQWSLFTVKLPPADQIYQSFWFWWQSAGTAGQLKLVQVHGDANMGDFAPGIMTGSSTTDWWFSYISTESGANNARTQVTYPKVPTAGSWHRFEMALKRSSAGGVADGSVTIWIDGSPVYSKQNVVTRENSAYNWSETSFFHGVTNMGASTDVYVDDVYVNDSWARVIIGNAPTYSSVTRSEIQPVKAWSNGSIQVTLNKGGLANFDNAYLYVIDRNGTVNSNGYKLCSGCQQQTRPKPPYNVTAE